MIFCLKLGDSIVYIWILCACFLVDQCIYWWSEWKFFPWLNIFWDYLFLQNSLQFICLSKLIVCFRFTKHIFYNQCILLFDKSIERLSGWCKNSNSIKTSINNTQKYDYNFLIGEWKTRWTWQTLIYFYYTRYFMFWQSAIVLYIVSISTQQRLSYIDHLIWKTQISASLLPGIVFQMILGLLWVHHWQSETANITNRVLRVPYTDAKSTFKTVALCYLLIKEASYFCL
jgi:hypothetical protein